MSFAICTLILRTEELMLVGLVFHDFLVAWKAIVRSCRNVSLLRPLVSGRGTLDDALVDNACSGVSKILVALVQGVTQGGSPLLPAAQTLLAIEQVLPVLLHALPIQSDHEEDKPVYVDCIGRLLHIGSGSAGGGGLAVAQEICRGPLVKLLPQVVTALVTAMLQYASRKYARV